MKASFSHGLEKEYSEKRIGVVYLTNSFNGLSIGPDIVKQALSIEEDFGLTWLNYARYDSGVAEFLSALEQQS